MMEDWLWHAIFPMTAYVILIAGAAMMHLHTVVALFEVAAVSIVLIYIGIHNAWDTVVKVVVFMDAPRWGHVLGAAGRLHVDRDLNDGQMLLVSDGPVDVLADADRGQRASELHRPEGANKPME